MKTNRVQKLKDNFWTIWFAITKIFRKKYVANECKHKTTRTGWTVSFGERYVMGMPLAKNGKPDYCLECIGKMAIRCGWCRKPIHIASLITLYLRNADMPCLKEPDWFQHVRTHQDRLGGPVSVVGCPRTDCADTGGDYCGQWLPPGRVHRFASVFEKLAQAVEDGEECPVIMAKV